MLPHLGAMLAHLEAYVGPCWPILSHKLRKMGKNGKSTKHRKTREFLATRRGRRQGARPLSPTERRETPSAMPRPGGPWPDKGLRPLPPTPGLALHLRMAPTIGVSALGAGATGADSEQRNWEKKNILPIGNEMLQWM